MIREAYISDNPWRLLGLGSAVNYKGLRPRAETVFDSVNSGAPIEVPLKDVFGDDSIGALPGLVRSLGADPVKRTMCRYFWVLDARAIPVLEGGELDGSHLPSFARKQADFLDNWYHFLAEGKPVDLGLAVRSWQLVTEDAEIENLLQSLLVEEDSIPESRAAEFLKQAQFETAKHICRRSFTWAQRLIKIHQPDRGVELIDEISRSSMDRNAIAASITPLVQEGEDLAARVGSCPFEVITTADDELPVRPPEVVALERLTVMLESQTSATDAWRREVRRYNDEFVRRVAEELQSRRRRGNPASTIGKEDVYVEEIFKGQYKAEGQPVREAIETSGSVVFPIDGVITHDDMDQFKTLKTPVADGQVPLHLIPGGAPGEVAPKAEAAQEPTD